MTETIPTRHSFEIVLKAEAEEEAEEFYRRIDDPQDLDDGLLAIAHEEMVARVKAAIVANWEYALFDALDAADHTVSLPA